MGKILPYIYFIAAVAWLVDGFILFFKDLETYRIFLDYTMDNKYGFIAFKIFFALLLVWAGVRRLRMQNES
ncbi:hypothetical protein [Pseudotenacibaculum haliotis]|uniref:Uncharacterized protein n=1 Tax=Pseudotenacibaculum haliotis TaxID=1862138 RepID=A0ABW5LV55_9FLAO